MKLTREQALENLKIILRYGGLMMNAECMESIKMATKAYEQEPCENAVSRDFMYKLGARCIAVRNENDELIAIAGIDGLPPVTLKPKTGKWEYGYTYPDGNYCKCSECKEIIKCIYPMHYCPNCGAKMESEGEE